MNDIPLRSAADEVKRIASDQRNARVCSGCEYRNVLRVHYGDLVDNVSINTVRRHDVDCISSTNVLQSPKESVPVSCDTNIAYFTRLWGSYYVTDRTIQAEIIGSLQDGHL